MDRKNINRGFRKLRVWQDSVALYVLACKIFTNIPLFQYSKKLTLTRILIEINGDEGV
jgi:hypothetical protein